MTNFMQNITGVFKKDEALKVLSHPDKRLYQPAEAIDNVTDEEIVSLIKGLKKSMKIHDGVGMAAPQVGVMKRIFIYNAGSEEEEPRVLINPVITYYSDELSTSDEGCLSFPNIYFPVERSERVTVTGLDESGSSVTLEEIDGLLARIVQHECDHLDGVMITDRAKPHIRKLALRAYATYDQQPEEFITIVDDEEPAS